MLRLLSAQQHTDIDDSIAASVVNRAFHDLAQFGEIWVSRSEHELSLAAAENLDVCQARGRTGRAPLASDATRGWCDVHAPRPSCRSCPNCAANAGNSSRARWSHRQPRAIRRSVWDLGTAKRRNLAASSARCHHATAGGDDYYGNAAPHPPASQGAGHRSPWSAGHQPHSMAATSTLLQKATLPSRSAKPRSLWSLKSCAPTTTSGATATQKPTATRRFFHRQALPVSGPNQCMRLQTIMLLNCGEVRKGNEVESIEQRQDVGLDSLRPATEWKSERVRKQVKRCKQQFINVKTSNRSARRTRRSPAFFA